VAVLRAVGVKAEVRKVDRREVRGGVPEWGDVRSSVWLTKDGSVVVDYLPGDLQSFRKAVELSRGLGMRDTCESGWCFAHFTARGPEGGRPGFVRITADGLRYVGWLALRGDEGRNG
jgi:hypothetical protein